MTYFKNIKIKFSEIDHKKTWVNSMIGMTIGFLATLVAGTIIGLLGLGQNNLWSQFVENVKKIMTEITPLGIGIGVAYKLKLAPYQILATGICAQILAQSTMIPHFHNGDFDWSGKIGMVFGKETPGDVFAAWIGSVFFVYLIKSFAWHNFTIAIILIPLLGGILGMVFSMFLTYGTSTILVLLQASIYFTVSANYVWAVLLAPVIGILVGLALSFPTSSVAISVALHLQGYAATAAIAGTAGQMVAFGIMTYFSNKSVSKSLAVGLGSSMLQMKNFMFRPQILIIPIIASGLCALMGVALLHLPFDYTGGKISVTPGMGTCALYGQIYTLVDNGFSSWTAWLNVFIIQLALPAVITLSLYPLFHKLKWVNQKHLLI